MRVVIGVGALFAAILLGVFCGSLSLRVYPEIFVLYYLCFLLSPGWALSLALAAAVAVDTIYLRDWPISAPVLLLALGAGYSCFPKRPESPDELFLPGLVLSLTAVALTEFIRVMWGAGEVPLLELFASLCFWGAIGMILNVLTAMMLDALALRLGLEPVICRVSTHPENRQPRHIRRRMVRAPKSGGAK